MMFERDTQMLRHDVEPVTGKLGPYALGNAHTIEPCRLDHRAVMDQAGCGEGPFIEIGMGNGRATTQMTVHDGMDIGKAGLAHDMPGGNPVNARVEAAEMIPRVDQRLILKGDCAIAEPDDTDLADATDAGACRFDIDDHEIRLFAFVIAGIGWMGWEHGGAIGGLKPNVQALCWQWQGCKVPPQCA